MLAIRLSRPDFGGALIGRPVLRSSKGNPLRADRRDSLT